MMMRVSETTCAEHLHHGLEGQSKKMQRKRTSVLEGTVNVRFRAQTSHVIATGAYCRTTTTRTKEEAQSSLKEDRRSVYSVNDREARRVERLAHGFVHISAIAPH
jgi:hypothetical protein